jgi:Zn-dependent M28 family amino/carboxypeptidase
MQATPDIALSISLDSIKKHLQILGSDSLQGRRTGTPGGERAARYIAQQLESIGLNPIGEEGTFFQWIPMHGSIPQPTSELDLFIGENLHHYQLNRDYLLYKSGEQTFIPNPIPLIFVGYGITAPEYDYNDYQSLDVEGKIVVFLSGEPVSDDPGYFRGDEPTVYSYPESKQRIAISHGAYGSILIHGPNEEKIRPWSDLTNQFAFEDVDLAYSAASNLGLVMNASAAGRLFSGSLFDLDQVLEMENALTLHSFPLKSTLRFRGQFQEREFSAPNIVGLLPAESRKADGSYLILTAHYDHLGIGPPVKGDSIYNGVMDNAIGVSALLEIARAMKNALPPQKRSILFLFTTGEEEGLLGSTYYTDHPIVPLYKTVANINIDGLAMFDRFKNVVGVGAELSTLGEYLEGVAEELGYYVSPIPSEFSATESFSRADQIAFAKAGIPSILIAEGMDGFNLDPSGMKKRMIDWMRNIYHSPFDDLRQPINYAAVLQHCRFLCSFCYSLADSSYEVKWNPGTPYINTRLRSIAERK